MHKNQVQHDQKSMAKKRESGLRKVTIWVPERDRERALNYAARLRREFEKEKTV